jgi:hypothetical protein
MQAKLPLRISSIILFLFALGHTVGFQTFRPASQQGLEVMEAMRNVPFAFGNATVRWMDLYMGFGLSVSVSGFFSAMVAWRLSSATIAEIRLARMITWLLCATQVASIILSIRYFGLVQAGFSLVSFAALFWSAIRLNEASKGIFPV